MTWSRNFVRTLFDAYFIQQSLHPVRRRDALRPSITTNEGLVAFNEMHIIAATWKVIADSEAVPVALKSFLAPLFEIQDDDLYSESGLHRLEMISDAVLSDHSLFSLLETSVNHAKDEKRYFVTRSG